MIDNLRWSFSFGNSYFITTMPFVLNIKYPTVELEVDTYMSLYFLGLTSPVLQVLKIKVTL